MNNQLRGVRESPPEPGSLRESNLVLSVDEVLEEALAVEVDEDDEEDDWVILDNGDFPGCFGRGATIVCSVTGGGTSAGLAPTLTGEEDTDCDNQ